MVSLFMYKIIRYFLFLIDAERAHHLTINLLSFFGKFRIFLFFSKLIFGAKNNKETILFGLKFKNKVGLAAGLDKNGEAINMFAALGFGFVEIGTVTPRPQLGNPQPRLFRLPIDKALINRMGFNNKGADVVLKNIVQAGDFCKQNNILIGANIGKNKDTSNEDAVKDYLYCLDVLYDVVDYFVVNVSSPNTPNLRALQDKEPLKNILSSLQNRRKEKQKYKPILLKIAPDLNEHQLLDIAAIANELQLDGLVATNTTIERDHLQTSEDTLKEIGSGGLSGAPLSKKSTSIIAQLRSKTDVPIIGVGGVFSAKDAKEKIESGADAIQVYTGFIYKGPSLVNAIAKNI